MCSRVHGGISSPKRSTCVRHELFFHQGIFIHTIVKVRHRKKLIASAQFKETSSVLSSV